MQGKVKLFSRKTATLSLKVESRKTAAKPLKVERWERAPRGALFLYKNIQNLRKTHADLHI